MARRGNSRGDEVEFKSEVVEIRRVSKVVKGGKSMSFRVVVAVGDGLGRVGVGKGNTREIPPAIHQGAREAKRNLVRVPLVDGRTIPHEVVGAFKASRVLLKPAPPGTGIIASDTVRRICRLAGIRDILTKNFGSTNPITLSKAIVQGFEQLRTVEEVARLRDKDVEEIRHVEAE